MATPEENLEKLLADFEKANPTGGKNLRAILKDTPELKDRFLDAVKSGNLDKIDALDTGSRARGVLGTYNPTTKTIALPMDYLDIADKNVAAGNMIRTTAATRSTATTSSPRTRSSARTSRRSPRAPRRTITPRC